MRHQLGFRDGSAGDADRPESQLPFGDIRTLVDLHVTAQMNAGGATVIGHGPKVFLEDLLIDNHARRREIFFMKILEITARQPRLDFVVAVRVASGKRRGGCRDTASGGGAKKTSTRSHMKILSHTDPERSTIIRQILLEVGVGAGAGRI